MTETWTEARTNLLAAIGALEKLRVHVATNPVRVERDTARALSVAITQAETAVLWLKVAERGGMLP